MSEFGDPRNESNGNNAGNGNGNGNGVSPAPPNPVADQDPDQDLAASVAGDSVAGTTTGPATNPRKRKKSSRASVSTFSVLLDWSYLHLPLLVPATIILLP